MTVKQLRELLAGFDPETEVHLEVDDEHGDWCVVGPLKILKLNAEENTLILSESD